MAKRERDTFSVKDLMGAFIKENNLSKGMQKLKIEEVWATLMGQGVVSYTQKIQLQNRTLVVTLSSSVLREELSYGKEKIIKMMNQELGSEVISKIILA